jgi:hypothetical protein
MNWTRQGWLWIAPDAIRPRCEPLPNRALNRTYKQLRCALLLCAIGAVVNVMGSLKVIFEED